MNSTIGIKISSTESLAKVVSISAQLFEHDRPCELQFFQNLSITYQEISDEIDAEDDE